MNFFTKTLSSFTGGSIPYTIKDKIVDPLAPTTSLDRNSIWTLYNGANPKDNNAPVSIFEFKLTEPANQQRVDLAKNAFKKLKMIKFPSVVSILDFIENDYILYIITEPVTPLLTYLETTSLGADSMVAGIYSIAQSLAFVNDSANSVYGGLNMSSSIFVNLSGDWKLMGFELVTNLTSDPDQPIYRLSRFMPVTWRDYCDSEDIESIRNDPKKFDSFRFGKFIKGVFEKNETQVPAKLATSVRRLTLDKATLRSSVGQYLKELEAWHLQNPVIRFGDQVNELKFVQEDEKLRFFKYELPEYFENDSSFPPRLLQYKLLPELIHQYKQLSKSANPNDPERQETLSTILNLTIKFGAKLPAEEFNQTIKPIIIDSFALADRSIRLVLLTHLPEYEGFLTESDIQYKIFNHLITGFQDTNFMIRETTLKSITIVIDKISVKQVNQELLRILAKSQMDPKPSIRVNTLILIIKISLKIYKTSKNNVLITALSKSLRDSFIPCKMTALHGFETLIEEFSLEEICTKILGNLAISLMDQKLAKVRVEAKRIFQLYLDSVESHAKLLPDNEVDEDEEEREFYKKFAPANPPPSQTATTEDKLNAIDNGDTTGSTFGWGSKLFSLGGSMNQDFNRSTPDITGQPPILPPEDNASAWDDDVKPAVDEVIVEPVRKINLGKSTDPTTPKTPIAASSKAAPRKTTSLKLGKSAAKPKPKPKIQLDLKVEENDLDDGWDEGW
ncbi:N-terminal kinase-like protein [Candida viswanathii]|uniref:N-terminal kinase-like protein n=1 Tax=Candida viswanathii TaxID=5486 RepID=A0A367Y0H3_9ASCO|nr:N-terminal kinase-like protein [Candida viswanathii]